MLKEIKKQITKMLSNEIKIDEEKVANSLEIIKEKFGDLCSKIAFDIGKQQGKNPTEVAKIIAEKMPKHKYIEKICSAGPYVNFFFSSCFFSEITEKLAKNKGYGKKEKNNKKTIVEFPSVNPNKPWHVGHLRNALLGDSIAKILSFNGENVEVIDYIDDLGLQMAQSLYGYKEMDSKKKFDHLIGEQYVRIANEMENPKVRTKVAELLKKMENREKEISNKARELSEKVIKAQYQTSFAFNIYHDVLVFESDIINTIFSQGLEKLKKSRIIHLEETGKNKGCWVVQLSEKYKNQKENQKILIRSNGTATYTGKDVIFQLWKFGLLEEDFLYEKFILQPNKKTAYKTSENGEKMNFGKADKVINIIGVEQTYPQEVIRDIMLVLGYEKQSKNLIHLAYEHAILPTGKFSGRQGTWVGYSADEFLEEMKKRAKEKITKEMDEKQKQVIANKVGIGAIKFSFLRTSPEKKIIFNWESALSFEGDSGPYIQYAYVRALGILKKCESEVEYLGTECAYNEDEKILIKELSKFEEIVEKSAQDLRPHYIADYALDIATLFNKFYTKNPVLNAEKNERTKRLAIVRACANILKNSLYLLGIDTPDEM